MNQRRHHQNHSQCTIRPKRLDIVIRLVKILICLFFPFYCYFANGLRLLAEVTFKLGYFNTNY